VEARDASTGQLLMTLTAPTTNTAANTPKKSRAENGRLRLQWIAPTTAPATTTDMIMIVHTTVTIDGIVCFARSFLDHSSGI
jgi:hypothetical protein